MAVEDDKNEALEEVYDLESEDQAETDEDGLSTEKKPPNKILIGILSVVICLVLFMLFRGEKDPPQQVVEGPDISTPGGQNRNPVPMPKEEGFEGAVLEKPTSELEAGEILIQSEGRNIEALPPSEGSAFPPPEEVPAVSIPEKELAFFEALKKNRENRPTSASQDDQLSRQTKKVPPLAKEKSGKTKVAKPAAQSRTRTPIIVQKKKSKEKKKPVLSVNSSFTIQLGAFKKERSASALSERLIKGGYDAYILAVRDDLFRVRVGTFQSPAAAKVVAEQIKSSDRLNFFIVKR